MPFIAKGKNSTPNQTTGTPTDKHSDDQIDSRQTHNNRANSAFNCIHVEPRTAQLGVRPVSNVGKENVNNVNDRPDESELVGALFTGSVVQPSETNISWEVEMPVPNGIINFKIDTGADVTVVPQ